MDLRNAEDQIAETVEEILNEFVEERSKPSLFEQRCWELWCAFRSQQYYLDPETVGCELDHVVTAVHAFEAKMEEEKNKGEL